MKARAAVAWAPKQPLSIEDIVDVTPDKFGMAKALGATDFVNPE